MGRVFIWGDYSYGNFGDTLQARLVSDFLIKHNFSVSIYKTIEATKGAISKNFLFDGVKDSDFVVLGGGAVFSKLFLNHPNHLLYDKEIGLLVSAINYFKKKTIGISIGCGQTKELMLTLNQRNLLKSAFFHGGTVRLKQDEVLLSPYNSFTYYPDIVFLSRHLVQNNLSHIISLNARSVLINFPSFFILDFLINIVNFLFQRNIFVRFSIFSKAFKKGEFIPRDSKGLNVKRFKSSLILLKWLESKKGSLLITHKLHLFVCFLSMNGLPISFFAYSKTKLFLKEHGILFFSGSRGFLILLLSLLSKEFASFITETISHVILKNCILAKKHLLYLYIFSRRIK